jgi:hypothetical protein
MESHSETILKLEAAKKKQITLKWWDPYFEGPKKQWPQDKKAEHNKEIELNEIYFGLPVSLRKKHSSCARLAQWTREKFSYLRNFFTC